MYLHPRELAKLELGGAKFDADRVAMTALAGATEEALASLEEAFRQGKRYLSGVVDPELINEGDRLLFDGFGLDVLHVPGHSVGHIALYESGSGVLFSGDHLLKDISSNPALEPSADEADGRSRSLPSYLSSLRRLRGMDISLVMPGHGEAIHDPDARIEALFRHHRRRSEFIYGLLDEKCQSIYALVSKVFRNLSGMQVFLAVSEIIGHIDVLAEQGRAAFDKSNGVLHCYRTGESTSRRASRASS